MVKIYFYQLSIALMNNQDNNKPKSKLKPNIQKVHSTIKYEYEYTKVKCYICLKEK